jgi:SAM-dependent methyltransferase
VVDCGCGSAYLTFAVYHYLNDMLGLPTRMTGVDIKADLLAGHADKVAALGWVGLDFEAARIIDFQPPVPPDIVLALHACDTATDEALAQAIGWGSKLIFSAPCCHHHLQAQLENGPLPFQPILRHGILKERLSDILTDSLRALILRIMGYRTDVMELVAAEHTNKNLMIRAIRTAPPGERRFVEEYRALTEYWQVRPYLETLLGEAFTALL